MATVVFNGTQNVTTAFIPANDTVILDGFNVRDVRSLTESGTSVQLALNNGTVLTLTGVVLASLSSADFISSNSDIIVRIGTNGIDSFVGAAGAQGASTGSGNLVVGLQGNDGLVAATNNSLVYGNQGVDTISGTVGANSNLRIFAGQDNDVVDTFGAGSVVYGGQGADSITAGTVTGTAGVTVYGGNGFADAADGNDTIIGSAGADQLFGNAGNDSLTGGGGRDSIYGGLGDDTIVFDANTLAGSVAFGGLGVDNISAATSGIAANTAGVTIYGGNGVADTLDGADSITGSAGNDAIYGNGGADRINSGGGRDSIYGGAGDDTIGGDNAGAIDGTVAADLTAGSVVYGGNGSDVINVSVAPNTALGQTAAVTQIFGGNGVTDTGDGADRITVGGTATNVQAFGNGGNDIINVASTGGSVSANGGAGNDTLSVTGVGGNVTVAGGIGNDIFQFGNTGGAPTSSATTANLDRILDLNFDQDSVRVQGFTVTSVSTVNVTNNPASLDAIQDSASTVAGQATLINVSGGSFAGSYLAFGNTGDGSGNVFINVTGYTGSIDATDFGTYAVV